jgi:hypothetical protein
MHERLGFAVRDFRRTHRRDARRILPSGSVKVELKLQELICEDPSMPAPLLQPPGLQLFPCHGTAWNRFVCEELGSNLGTDAAHLLTPRAHGDTDESHEYDHNANVEDGQGTMLTASVEMKEVDAFSETVTLPKKRAIVASFKPGPADLQGDALNDILDHWALQRAVAEPDFVPDIHISFEPVEEDIMHVVDQLKCTQCFAKAVMLEINVVSVTSQLQCSRAWAIKLLGDND